MANDTRYNGWTNYQTWVVNLWLDNEQDTSEEIDGWAREEMQTAIDNDESDVRMEAHDILANRLESFIDDLQENSGISVTGMFADLLNNALHNVDWHEIASHHIDEITLYSAGWNMPGYMPDNAPAMFIDASDALEYIKDQMRNSADGEGWASDDVEAIETIRADSKGEYGCTMYNFHYFISVV